MPAAWPGDATWWCVYEVRVRNYQRICVRIYMLIIETLRYIRTLYVLRIYIGAMGWVGWLLQYGVILSAVVDSWPVARRASSGRSFPTICWA